MKKGNTEDIYSLTSTQHGMLYHHVKAPYSGEYVIQLVTHIEGELNTATFQSAWERLFSQHEILRTLFVWSELVEPVQVVRKTTQLPWEVIDWRHLDEKTQKKQLDSYLRQDREQGFDLGKAPLLRLRLFQLDNQAYYFVWSYHHLILDGWSLSLLFNDLLHTYQSLSRSQQPTSTPSMRYKDYVLWQKKQDHGKAEKFWQQYLNGFTAPTPILNITKQTASNQTLKSTVASCKYELTEAISKKLNNLSRKHKVTLNTTIQAAWSILLHRYSREKDVVFGSVVSGRNADIPYIEKAIGLFINTLPVRVNLDQNSRIIDLLNTLQADHLERESFAYSSLAEIQRCSSIGQEYGLFESIIIFENYPIQSNILEAPAADHGITIKNVQSFEQTNYGISLYIVPGHTISASILYAPYQYDEVSIENLLNHFSYIVEQIATTDVYRKINTLSIVPEKEQALLSQQLSSNKCTITTRCVNHLFEQQAKITPDSIAVVFNEETLTYRCLNEHVNRLAHYLQDIGVKLEDRVGIHLNRSLDIIIAILGTLKAGATYIPLDPVLPRNRIDTVIADAGITVLISETPFAKDNDERPLKLVSMQADRQRINKSPKHDVRCNPSNAYLIYTSGSTGKPKGVLVSHQNIINAFEGFNKAFPKDNTFTLQNTWLAITSISFDISVLELLWSLARGDKIIIQGEYKAGHQNSKPIDFSLAYFSADEEKSTHDKYHLLKAGACFADNNDFAAVWLPERHFHAFGGIYPNPSVVASAVAALTEKVNIRAGSVVSPLHNPIRIAEEWSMVDNLSNGRVGLSFASGWHPNDFVLAKNNYTNRKQLMLEQIDNVKRLWLGESLSLENGEGQCVEIKIRPKPIQNELPIWLTAAGDPNTFRIAGEQGANLLTHLLGQSVDELGEKIKLYRHARAQNGYAPEQGHVTLMLHTFIGDDLATVKETVAQPFKNYLRSSISLLKPLALKLGIEDSKEHEDVLVEQGFKRFFSTSALLGTAESCIELIEQLQAIGVNEIACLIDFGITEETVIANFDYLKQLKTLAATRRQASTSLTPVELIERHRVTHLQCTPTFCNMLLDIAGNSHDNFSTLSSLKTLLIGGEPLPSSLTEKLAASVTAELFNMYGPTETTIWSGIKRINTIQQDYVSIGLPITNTDYYIVDDNNQWVPRNITGELCIGGQSVTQGYYNRPDLTAKQFIPNPFNSKSGDRLYKTGDLVRYLPTGEIEFIGRIDHQVKIKGFRIELGEIEQALMHYAGVDIALVTVSKTEHQEQCLIAYLLVDNKQQIDEQVLSSYLKTILPEYMLPSVYFFMDAFPLSISGKVDYKQLPQPHALGMQTATHYMPAKTATEEIMVGLWIAMLGQKNVGINDNFFNLGGHSLFATQLVSRLKRVFQVEVPLGIIFEKPTIHLLSHYIDKIKASKNTLDIPEIKPVPRSDRLVLSYAQQRLWFLYKLEPKNPFYNMPHNLKFIGKLDVDILEDCFRHVMHRHENLRTTFDEVDNEPTAIIANTLNFTISHIDLSHLSQQEQDDHILQHSIREAEKPFNFTQGPLIRASLLKLSAEEHILLLTLHHIICDGWSMGVMSQEIITLYQALTQYQPSPLTTLPIQYVDFAHWQQQWLQGDVFQQQLAFWEERLKGIPTVIDLPLDYPRGTRQSFKGAREYIHFSPTLNEKLQAFCHQHSVTMYMLLLTAYKTLLHSYSGQEQFIIGCPVANRNHGDTEKLIGFFVNMLPLVSDLTGNPKFSDLLKNTRRSTLQAYEHQDFPFEFLVKHLQTDRTLSHMPLVQAIFVLHNYPFNYEGLSEAGLHIETMGVGTYQSKFDLALSISFLNQESPLVEFEYNIDVLNAQTVRNMLYKFNALLEAVIDDCNQRISVIENAVSTKHDLSSDADDSEAAFMEKLKAIKKVKSIPKDMKPIC